MKLLTSLPEIIRSEGRVVPVGLTIGNFDGVHVGHRQLLNKIKNECAEKGLSFVVVTFVPHPQKILQPEKERFLLNSYEKRRELLSELGVNYLVEMKFTRDFSTLPPEEFMKKYLFDYEGLRDFYLGYDFAFGANKQGGHDLAREFCRPLGIHVEIQPKFEVNGEVVSSTLIRDLIQHGKVDEAEKFLSRAFHLEGVVIKGEGRGKKIGYPTANIQVSPDLIVPENGVYVTRTRYQNMTYKSVTNIGHNPTFKEGRQLHIETNIFDFDSDIYGEKLEIEFLKKIRDEKKFPTVNDLIVQIKADVETARKVLST
jgi:riboflavin kinase/FMN adenylyltransferase